MEAVEAVEKVDTSSGSVGVIVRDRVRIRVRVRVSYP